MATLLDHLPRTRSATCLRRFKPADTPTFARYRADVELARYQGWSPIELDVARAFVDEMAALADVRLGDWIQLAIAESESDDLVGDLGMFVDAEQHEAEIGFTVAREFQGLGHAANAVRLVVELLTAGSAVSLIRATTDVRNLPSVRLLERGGFTADGEHSVEFKGELCIERTYRLRLPRRTGS